MASLRKIEISRPWEGLEEARLRQWEASEGISLPDDYRTFLLETNGGRPKQRCFDYADESGPYTDGAIQAFHGIHGETYNRLDKIAETSKAVVPGSFLPIASDSFGNSICLGISGPERGKVYFFDEEGASDGEPEENRTHLHRIADSFREFLDVLKP